MDIVTFDPAGGLIFHCPEDGNDTVPLPEIEVLENTLFGPKGKAHKVFGKRKRKFCRVQGPDAMVLGVWVQTPGTLASGPGVREGLLPFG